MTSLSIAPSIILSLAFVVMEGVFCFGQQTIQLQFQPTYRGQTVAFDSSEFRTAEGATITVSMVKFYLNGLVLRMADGEKLSLSETKLLDLSEPEDLSIPIEKHQKLASVSFTIGVDSLVNEQGPREGDLDPRNGMYWTWATGYIFFKLEGTIESSSQPKRAYELHIGGYKAPFRNMIDVHCTIPVRSRSTRDVIIDVDLARLLEGPNSFDLAKRPSVTTAQQAVDVAPLIGEMFRVR